MMRKAFMTILLLSTFAIAGCSYLFVESAKSFDFVPGVEVTKRQNNVCTATLYFKPRPMSFVGQETTAWLEVVPSVTNEFGLWNVQAMGTWSFGTNQSSSNIRWNSPSSAWWFSWVGTPVSVDEFGIQTRFDAIVQCVSNKGGHQAIGDRLRIGEFLRVVANNKGA